MTKAITTTVTALIATSLISALISSAHAENYTYETNSYGSDFSNDSGVDQLYTGYNPDDPIAPLAYPEYNPDLSGIDQIDPELDPRLWVEPQAYPEYAPTTYQPAVPPHRPRRAYDPAAGYPTHGPIYAPTTDTYIIGPWTASGYCEAVFATRAAEKPTLADPC